MIRKIDLGFHSVKVRMVSEKRMRKLAGCKLRDDVPEGLWDTDKGTIYLLKGLGWKRTRYYLCHEMVHACLDLMDSLEIGP